MTDITIQIDNVYFAVNESEIVQSTENFCFGWVRNFGLTSTDIFVLAGSTRYAATAECYRVIVLGSAVAMATRELGRDGGEVESLMGDWVGNDPGGLVSCFVSWAGVFCSPVNLSETVP